MPVFFNCIMSCKICKIKPVWKFTNKTQLCSKCFLEHFEKKVKNTIRKYQMPICAVKRGSLKIRVINSITRELPERKGKISDENLDYISAEILYTMMYKDKEKLKNFLPKNQPLYFLSDREILLYARIKKINGKVEKIKNKKLKEIDSFIKIIEERNPDIRSNIVTALLRYLL